MLHQVLWLSIDEGVLWKAASQVLVTSSQCYKTFFAENLDKNGENLDFPKLLQCYKIFGVKSIFFCSKYIEKNSDTLFCLDS